MIDFFTLMILAECSNKNSTEPPVDWEQLGETRVNKNTGFEAKVFKNDENEIVISFAATNPKHGNDIRNDINMAVGNLPPQAINAQALYNEIRRDYPNAKITLTGYSLGASISQVLAKMTGAKAVVFNPFSTGDDNGKDYPNITNIINSRDFISMSDINTQPGKIFVTPNASGNILMSEFNLNPKYDKMNAGKNHHKLNSLKQMTKKVFDSWDNMREGKAHLSKNEENTHGVTINGNHV